MRKQNGTVSYEHLAILAGSVGLVENTEDGRQAFTAWLGKDLKAARKALFTRVAARRVAASAKASRSMTAAEAQAGRTGHPTTYPAAWARQARSAAGSVARATAQGQTPVIVAGQYPAGWLPAAGVAGRRHDEARVVEVND